MPRPCEAVRCAEAEAIQLGATFSWEYASKHIVAIISYGQNRRKVFISKSASDWRVLRNIEEDVRRKINQMKRM